MERVKANCPITEKRLYEESIDGLTDIPNKSFNPEVTFTASFCFPCSSETCDATETKRKKALSVTSTFSCARPPPGPAPWKWKWATNLDACDPFLLTVADKRVFVLHALNRDTGPFE